MIADPIFILVLRNVRDVGCGVIVFFPIGYYSSRSISSRINTGGLPNSSGSIPFSSLVTDGFSPFYLRLHLRNLDTCCNVIFTSKYFLCYE